MQGFIVSTHKIWKGQNQCKVNLRFHTGSGWSWVRSSSQMLHQSNNPANFMLVVIPTNPIQIMELDG